MEPQDMQQQEMTPEEAKASMGMATTLQEGLLGNAGEQAEMGSQEAQNAPEQEMMGQPETGGLEEMESRIMEEIGALRDEIKKSKGGDDEIEELKKEIEAVLNDEQES